MKVIGLMSGTSCDGLDIAYCEFNHDGNWSFEILNAVTVEYSNDILKLITDCQTCDKLTLEKHHKYYGEFIALTVKEFMAKHSLKPDLIASHGHTIFHEPEKCINLQLGDGNAIANTTGIPTVYDFRTLDIKLGGQGAPLVPIGDKLLFSEYDYCINIGGFSNISFDDKGSRIAFDICPANIVFNTFAKLLGAEFDFAGELGSTGNTNDKLLKELDQIEYYSLPYPKSLGTEWLDANFIPILSKYALSPQDILRTLYEHAANQMSIIINKSENANVLLTGGGGLNTFFVQLLQSKTSNTIVIPDKKLIDYKEALIFAFLGLLRSKDMINCLSSVTGASRDSSCGIIVSPK